MKHNEECPKCHKPIAMILTEDIDIGVGVQRHIIGADCLDCGQLTPCNTCGSWVECFPHCAELKRILEHATDDLDSL